MRQVRAHGQQRGMTLLMVLSTLAVVTAATLVSLRLVSQESELQGSERRSREAFFAAEAGLAEGREIVTQLLGGNSSSFNGVMATLGDFYSPGSGAVGVVNEPDFPANGSSWYEVVPLTRYSLLPGSGLAVDPGVAAANQELRDPNGRPFLSFPEQSTLFYRVFLHDDEDDDQRGDDTNGAVWLVSMGEVQGGNGEVLARSVVRVLVAAGVVQQASIGYGGQKLGGSDKTSGGTVEQTPPVVSQSTTF
jgi:hypothetical protein